MMKCNKATKSVSDDEDELINTLQGQVDISDSINSEPGMWRFTLL